MDKPNELAVAIAALETKVNSMSNRLDNVEKHQLQLIELASFGKGSLKTLTMLELSWEQLVTAVMVVAFIIRSEFSTRINAKNITELWSHVNRLRDDLTKR